MTYTKGYRDEVIIPDKYNTGCKDELCVNIANAGDKLGCGLSIRSDQGYVDMNKAPNNTMEGICIVENYDFTSLKMGIYNASLYKGNGITVHFKNCKFNVFTCNQQNELVKTKFDNCSFGYYTGGYGELNNCYIGGRGTGDAANPYIGTTMNNCYIADICKKADEQGTAHIDGMQILTPIDITFNNCRWECPWLNYSAYYGGVTNAVRLEPQGDMKNVTFDNCIINGGGIYSIHIVEAGDAYTVENINFTDIKIGKCGNNPFYPNDTSEYFKDYEIISSIYASSVWKDENGIVHIIVSNDTLTERELVIVTDLETKTVVVPKNYSNAAMEVDTMNFEDLPIDIEYTVDIPNASWVVCYDTEISEENQIRCVVFSEDGAMNIKDLFEQICDAIRIKDGTTDLIKHSDIPQRILNLNVL